MFLKIKKYQFVTTYTLLILVTTFLPIIRLDKGQGHVFYLSLWEIYPPLNISNLKQLPLLLGIIIIQLITSYILAKIIVNVFNKYNNES